MGEAVFYLAAKYADEKKAERAIKTVESVAKGASFLNEALHEVRHQEEASPEERVHLLKLLAGDLERDSKEKVCVAEKLRTKIDMKIYLERKEKVGEFPDLTDFLPDNPSDDDTTLNEVVHTLPDVTMDFVLSQHGNKVLLSDYVWHHTCWEPLTRKIEKLTEPERIAYVSDEYTTVGDLLLKLLDFEEVKI